MRFKENTNGATSVRLAQSGWKTGEDWDAGFAYFDKRWSFVLEQLRETMEEAQ